MPENSGVRARKSAADSARGAVGSAMSSATARRGRGKVHSLLGLGLCENRSCGVAERWCLAGLDAPDKQAAKSGDEEAHRSERPGVLKRRVGCRPGRRSDDRYDKRDTERGSDLARNRIHPGCRCEAPARR